MSGLMATSETKKNTLLDNIRKMMKKLNMTAQQAMKLNTKD